MIDLNKYNENIFEMIKHFDVNGNEYWEARELQKALEYKEWRKFYSVIEKAKKACESSNINIFEQFVGADKLSKRHNNAYVNIKDYKLSRYACYLIVQNADSRKQVIALGQTYFAVQTRKQELSELQYENLSENEKRLYQRSLTKKGNYSLNLTAKKAGVKNFGEFHNAGYKGLYNGETADDIAKRKELRYREDILDNMCSEEFVDNLFRIVQTESKIKRENIKTEKSAKIAHYEMGRSIRNFIKSQNGIMPEDLPTPSKSLKEIEKNKDSNFIE